MPDPAPATLRVVSAGLLGGGALAGFAAAAVTSRRLLPALALGVAGLILTIARADRRPPVSRRVISPPSPAGSEASGSPTRDRLTFSIVVAARDEAVVLPALVADVARRDYRRLDGTVGCELIVVDDRSVDGTAEAVLAAAVAQGIAHRTRIIRRDGPGLPDGKGAASTAAQRRPAAAT